MKWMWIPALVISLSGAALGTTGEKAGKPLETVTIIASRERLAGSGSVIGAVELEKFHYTDIHRILAQAPGVYSRGEEGYGLRPNISIRGSYGDRSGKITLMEDGVLIAPAPYTAAAAYYFPSIGRISGVEVLKGPAGIEHGPYTVGGAINLLSTPIPHRMGGAVNAEAGQDETWRLHGLYGGNSGNWGFLLESHIHTSDGFSDIANSSNSTGFRKDDWLAKLRYNSQPGGAFEQRLELKLQYSEEESEQTYVGLTEADFSRSPYLRYGLSREDRMDNRHQSINLSHQLESDGPFRLTTTAYYNDFTRNWYKVDKIDGEGINEVIICANGGRCAGMSSRHGEYNQGFANAVLSGEAAADVYLKNNNRDYRSQGVQTRLALEWSGAGWRHVLALGVRYHQDKEIRLQPVDLYLQGGDGGLAPVELGVASRSSREAEAWSLYLIDDIGYGDWSLKPGLRYETYTIRGADHDELLPGLGLTYDVDGHWQLLAGIHAGHSPSSSGDSDPETAANFEAGFRYRSEAASAELVAFFSDYDNIIGVCANSGGAGGDCELGDTDNGGAAEVLGLEFQASYSFALGSAVLPVTASYTYTRAEFKSSFSGSVWGNVEKGDRLPNLPPRQWRLNAALYLDNGLGGDLSLRHFDESCATAACLDFQQIDQHQVLDLALHYDLDDSTRFYLNVENLTANEDDVVSRQPMAGARGQKPRTLLAGFRYRF